MKNLFITTYSDDENGKMLLRIYDWLFNQDKFNSWTKSMKITYSKRIKSHFLKDNCCFRHGGSTKNISFPKENSTDKYFVFNGDTIAQDLLRHIRNSIAHNEFSIQSDKTIFIRDFRDDKKTVKTAQMKCSINDLIYLYSKFYEIEK